MESTDIICFCKKVTYGDIQDCVKSGATSVDEVMSKTGAGSACGGCKPRIQKIIEDME